VHVIAGASPDNTPAGYYWTFLFPMLLFIVIALILWALFGRPHQRVPAGRISLGLRSRVPDATTAHATSVAGGLSTAPGGGASESHHEPAGAGLAVNDEAEPEAPAGGEDTEGGQPSADGAEAGE
jgi:hypothetical protein